MWASFCIKLRLSASSQLLLLSIWKCTNGWYAAFTHQGQETHHQNIFLLCVIMFQLVFFYHLTSNGHLPCFVLTLGSATDHSLRTMFSPDSVIDYALLHFHVCAWHGQVFTFFFSCAVVLWHEQTTGGCCAINLSMIYPTEVTVPGQTHSARAAAKIYSSLKREIWGNKMASTTPTWDDPLLSTALFALNWYTFGSNLDIAAAYCKNHDEPKWRSARIRCLNSPLRTSPADCNKLSHSSKSTDVSDMHQEGQAHKTLANMLSWMVSITTETLSCQVFELEGWCQYSYVRQYRCLKKYPNLKWANDVFDHYLALFGSANLLNYSFGLKSFYFFGKQHAPVLKYWRHFLTPLLENNWSLLLMLWDYIELLLL